MDRIDWDSFQEIAGRIVEWALEEDAARSDVTSAALGGNGRRRSVCGAVAREELVVAGWPLVCATYRALAGGVELSQAVAEGGRAAPGTVIGTASGEAGRILMGERVALNLLCRMSGIATLTARYVSAVEGTGVEILDTRKTTPCHRVLERYAVRQGGGVNHRFDLSSMAMIKDNHIAAMGGIDRLGEVVEALRRDSTRVEIEVDSVEQLRRALEYRPDRILLDNMSPAALAEAVREASGSGCYLEASGGITLETVRIVAGTGVDGISIGGLTHSARSADIGFDWSLQPGGTG
jgi:nicotinate-nucleotide pyrophosphorylase (carboxylating)